MPDARTTQPRHALQVAVAGHEVDRDRVAVARDRERPGLADLAHEILEVGARDVAQVQSPEHGVGERSDAHTKPVSPRRRDVLHETEPRQRAQLA